MKTLKSHIVLLISLCGTLCSYGQNSNDLSTKVGYQVSLLQESKTADDVYIIKSRIDKLSLEAKLLGDKIKIRDSYLIMSDKFAFFNHFKSGVLVYFNYLEIDKEIHQNIVKSLKDSIQNLANNRISPSNNPQANNQSGESNAVDYSKESATDNVKVSKSSVKPNPQVLLDVLVIHSNLLPSALKRKNACPNWSVSAVPTLPLKPE